MSEAAKQISIVERTTPATSGALTPMDMLNHAVSSGAGLEMVDKLMGLQERWEANQARKAFVEAFAAFKAEAITVIRNKKITDGPLKGKSYAELSAFVDAVTPALSKHGLSASWQVTRDDKDWIEVTCIVEHVLGHSKRVALGGPPDAGGAKNAIQARMSTVTYLERHTFKAACGISEQGDDADGKSPGTVETITDEQVAELSKLLTDTGSNLVLFLKAIKLESLTQIAADKFEAAKKLINDTAAKRAAMANKGQPQ